MSLETDSLKHEDPAGKQDTEDDSECCGGCDFEFDDNAKKITFTVAGCLCCIGILLVIILIPVSLRKVEHDEYAIRYDNFTNQVYDTIYTEGKYVLTPQTSMVKFSNLVKKKEIVLTCLTSDGIEVVLEVDVQYQLPKNQVYNAYYDFGTERNTERYLFLVMTDSVRDVCGNYTAKEYYEDRMAIQNTLEDTLVIDVRNSNAYYNITATVLAAYDFPDPLEDSIKDKRAAENDIAIAENEREGALVEANTVLLTAKIEAEKIAIDAQAEEDSILAEADAQSEAIQSIWINRYSVYNDIIAAMNITVDRFVFQYLTSVIFLNAEDPITTLKYKNGA
eukprot:111055_1